MPDFFTVDFSEVHALAQRVPRTGPLVEREAEQTMQRIVLTGERKVKEKYRVDTGDGRRRVTSRVDRAAGLLIGRVGSNAPHAPTLEGGRRAGAKMPPEGSLVAWMRRHGIDPKSEFALRRAIGRNGFAGDFAFKKTLAEIAPLAEREFAAIVGRIGAVIRGAR